MIHGSNSSNNKTEGKKPLPVVKDLLALELACSTDEAYYESSLPSYCQDHAITVDEWQQHPIMLSSSDEGPVSPSLSLSMTPCKTSMSYELLAPGSTTEDGSSIKNELSSNKSQKAKAPSDIKGNTHGPITVQELVDIFKHHSENESFYETSLLKVWPLRLFAFTTVHGFLVWVMCMLLAEHFIHSPLVWDSMNRDRNLGNVMLSVRRAVMPTLKNSYRQENDAYFAAMHQPWNASYYATRDCMSELFDSYRNHTFVNADTHEPMISSDMIQDALRYYHLDEIPEVAQSISISQDLNVSVFLDETQTCLGSNHLLQTMACAVLDNAALQKPYSTTDASALSHTSLVNLHRALVVNQVVTMAVSSPSIKTRLVSHLAGHYYETTREAIIAASDMLPDKYVQSFVHHLDLLVLSLKQIYSFPNANTVDVGISTEAVTRSTIAVSAALDLEDGLVSNAKVGNLLNGLTNKLATLDDMSVKWDLGEAWMQTYVSWYMAHASRFGSQGSYWPMAVPAVSCSSVSMSTFFSGADNDANHFVDALKVSMLLQFISLPQILSSSASSSSPEQLGQYANPVLTKTWGDINLAHSLLPRPARDQMKEYFVSQCQNDFACIDKWDVTGDDPLGPSYLSNTDIGLFYQVALIISAVLAGSALEVFIGVYWANDFFPKYGDHWLYFANCIYSLLLAISVFSRSILGLPFAVLGLWKLGYPETLVCLNRTWLSWQRQDRVAVIYNYMNSLGLVLHHVSSIVVITQVMSGRYSYNRGIRNMIVPLVMQHWVCPFMPFYPAICAIVMVGMEILFEWEIIAYLQYADRQDYDITGRGTACSMVLSHWLYFFAYAIEKVHVTSKESKGEHYNSDATANKQNSVDKDSFENKLSLML
jgi:hypothetical protein